MSGACFGFRPVSDLAFVYLRNGAGEPLVIREHEDSGEDAGGTLIAEWTPIPQRRSWARLYQDNGGYRLWVERAGSFHVDPGAPSVDLPAGLESPIRREERLWGIPALLCFAERGDLALHAAAVEVSGEAILLAAPGYAGKTTLAAAFNAAGHRLLSEDSACIRFGSGPSLVPGPAMLRVRRDMAGRLDLPGARELAVGDDRVHFALDPARRGDCTPLSIRSVVFLRPGPDRLALEPLAPEEALRDLWALTWRLPGDDADRRRCFESIVALADAVPVWNLSRELRLDTLPNIVERIVADA